MPRKPYLFAAALASVIALCAVLAWMIADRASILRDGREIVLKTEPIDPRDLLRGRYVRLNYGISRIPPTLFAGGEIDDFESGAPIFVHVEEGGDGFWIATGAAVGALPADRDEGEVWVRGKTLFAGRSSETPASVAYGIERFYASEAIAPEIERRMRGGDVTDVVVAVGADGRAQIKALRQRGSTIFTEGLY